MPPSTVIVVPPFTGVETPSYAAHLLQAVAADEGFTVDVLYGSLMLAGVIGENHYQDLCYQPTRSLRGDQVFAPFAFPPAGEGGDAAEASSPAPAPRPADDLDIPTGVLLQWLDDLVTIIVGRGYDIVGCTSNYDQTLASLTILRAIKRRAPDTTTILGGANLEGSMADGWASVPYLDTIFSGESETSFVRFLRQWSGPATVRASGGTHSPPPLARIVRGAPHEALDELPAPDYREFFEQHHQHLPTSTIRQAGEIQLPYETSRGCWWGQKHHCTFCGLNGEGMRFRAKSPAKVIRDLESVFAARPHDPNRAQLDRVTMVDNIMPIRYFKDLLPHLGRLGLRIFYEQKANLSLEKVRALKEAGVAEIQPGIEALSTPLLALMNKGTTARQNVALLRYARSTDVVVRWNLLYGFPGDQADYYHETLRLVRLISHLPPPGGFFHLSIDRFSPYFDKPEAYGIERVRPIPAYSHLYPPQIDPAKVAYHFAGDYAHTGHSHPQLIDDIQREVSNWVDAWSNPDSRPALVVFKAAVDKFMLLDTRIGTTRPKAQFIDINQATAALVGTSRSEEAAEWATEAGAATYIDGILTPLAAATPELLAELKTLAGPGRAEDETDGQYHRITRIRRPSHVQ